MVPILGGTVKGSALSGIVLPGTAGGSKWRCKLSDRAPDGFTDLHDVISREELEAAATSYKRIAGFDRDMLNRRL